MKTPLQTGGRAWNRTRDHPSIIDLKHYNRKLYQVSYQRLYIASVYIYESLCNLVMCVYIKRYFKVYSCCKHDTVTVENQISIHVRNTALPPKPASDQSQNRKVVIITKVNYFAVWLRNRLISADL